MADEYIKRSDAIETLMQMCWHDGDGFPVEDADEKRQYAEDWVNAMPSADVQPVVHGEWIEARGSWCTPGGDPVWECSECGKGRHIYGIEHGTYGSDVADGQWVACPNCGADMRGGT